MVVTIKGASRKRLLFIDLSPLLLTEAHPPQVGIPTRDQLSLASNIKSEKP
jgi:hypothetical protein